MIDHKEDTQPVAGKTANKPLPPGKIANRDQRRSTRKRRAFQLFWVLFALAFLVFASFSGGLAGYFTGQAQRQLSGVVGNSQTVQQQFLLAVTDQEEGRLEIARQRFEWILNQDPGFPDAAHRLSQVLAILNATATPTAVPPTITPTPTPDLRPIQDLFSLGQSYFASGEWTNTIDTLINLRQKDPLYQVVEIDRMLFMALRNRGIDKVFQQGDLNGGMYDLVLAERFSPLDSDAQSAREWARLYLMGSSFWDVYPEQAVFFFSQVASAIPNLRDLSGWTARERLRGALIQWGDQLMSSEEPCLAQNKYEQAAELGLDSALQGSLERAVRECTPPTSTATQTPTLTATPTITTTIVVETPSPSPVPSSTVTATSTPPLESSPTPTLSPSATPSPTLPPTPTPPPSDTPPPPTETPGSMNVEPTQDNNQGLVSNLTNPTTLPLWVVPTLIYLGFFGLLNSNKPGQQSGKQPKKNYRRAIGRLSRFVIPIFLAGLVVLLAVLAATIAFVIGRELALFGTGISFLNTPEIITTNIAGEPVNLEGTPVSEMPSYNDELAALDMPELTPWDGASRVTVLLLGLDYRDWESGDKYSRSDTMILLTLDPLAKTAGILSVPRDMWVAIPGFKHGKINTAYYLGDAYQMPGGGPALAVKTVESFLGVPINYYAQIDFDSFIKFIDEIGGVKITVPEPITIDLLGAGAKTKKNLKPGEQVLPGDHALAYARARYTEGGDFDRAARQQQVIMGIRDRVLDFNLLPGLISKAPRLYQDLSSGIRTNMTVDQVVKLALLAQSVPDENIQRGVLGEKYVLFARSPDNLSILIPLPDKIHELRDQIFVASGAINPATPGDAAERMKAEAPRINLYNGTSDSNLESQTAEWLTAQGALITRAGNSDNAYNSTIVIDYTGNPFTIQYIVQAMGINRYGIRRDFNPDSSVDVDLILGSDWKQNNPFE